MKLTAESYSLLYLQERDNQRRSMIQMIQDQLMRQMLG